MSINSTMTALADEVRELSGKTGKLTLENMTDEVASGNETISDQTDLIAQIAQALEGKAAGGEEPIIEPLSVTENGTYTAPDGVHGYSPVTVNVKSGGTSDELSALLMNTLTTLDNSNVTSLRSRACQSATALVTVNLPLVTTVGTYAFYGCSSLAAVTLPKLKSVASQSFYSCTKLRHADCGNLGSIPAQTFNACSALTELILRKTGSICTLANVNGVSSTPIGKGTGYVYVNENMINGYVSASNWSTFPNQFRPLVDTIADLASIDGSVYDRAWVDDEYCVYIYDGSAWAKEA